MIELDMLRGLVVSVQADSDSPLASTEMITALALAAQAGGAVGVRIESAKNVRAVKAALSVPVIGLIKRSYAGFEPYITPTLGEVEELLDAGADVIAFDATLRARPQGATTKQLVGRIASGGAIAMADCATREDALAAHALDIPLLATTLCGYTKETSGASLPAIDLVRALDKFGGFVICEGGVRSPADVAAARDAGADAIVVGTAITNIAWVTAQLAAPLHACARTDATAVK
ncbi:MAG: putative N-acetylmannosamine-6-phosphate 2-epimerase [Candidatus Eremiobacteraeota bacterium]|nr:putative N-acetylmannosamine-6-phosphate 2-epimerase [Candidatus Eremiobacteraeota bacterium]MBV9736547.1 putative N-acetylmannosamine-6-phosphate 2-epimerase [Candidatus Eremiobacteraeota bacterium]